MERQTAPGLRYKSGRPYWRASKSAVRKGYPVKSVNLSPLTNRPAALVERCIRLQREMEEWLSGSRKPVTAFDGTFKGLFDLYETHDESTYHILKGSSRQSYDSYLRLMRHEIGDVVIDSTDGISLGRWFRAWSSNGQQLAKAHLCFKIIKAALVFAVRCRKPGCSQMLEIVRERVRTFPGLRPRESYITHRAVAELREAAHQLGHPHAALAYALQFEANQRQRDVVGEWLRLDEPTPPTDIVKGGLKWYGAHWSMVKNNVLEMMPSKTARRTGKKVVAPLSEYPMVVEELANAVHAGRCGPLIVHPQTGLPYSRAQWLGLWHDVCELVGIDHTENWNRDLRASGITEGDEADADLKDLATQSAHHEKTTKRHYIRGHKAVVRLAEKRRAYRAKHDKNNP